MRLEGICPSVLGMHVCGVPELEPLLGESLEIFAESRSAA